MVRAECMTLLLYTTVIYSVDAGNLTSKPQTTASKPGTSSTKDKDSMNRVSPKYSSGNQNGGNGKSNQNAECTLVPPQTNLQSLHEIGKRCPHIFNDKKTSETFIRQETNIINNIINTTCTDETMILRHLALDLAVVKTNSNTTESHINASELFNDTQAAQIWIPVEIFQNISGEEHIVGVVSYKSSEQFTFGLENAIIVSNVTRIEVPGHDIVNLKNLLKIYFPVKMATSNSNYHSCQFFDEKEFIWRDDGCSTRNIRDHVVECSCNHMTAFAVLLVELQNTDEVHWTIMSYISYIGCGLSAVFSGCSILTFIINSNGRKEVSRSIHVSLSAALFLLNITFMLSEWAATLDLNEVCVFVAVVIHYSLLCCFTWMAIEALHLYILLVRVFNIYIKHYMAKLSLIGWGVPAILIGGLLMVNRNPLYGTTKITLSDTNKTKEICWTTGDSIPYAVNISYFALIFLFNTGILITVSVKIFMLQKADNKRKTVNVCKYVSTVLGLMCLLGITWGLVFFTSGYTNNPILYLFCILNSMQGFYIFLWMCLTARPKRQQADQKSTFTVDTTDNYKQRSLSS